MKPKLFQFDQIPFDTMWPDDVHWFPYLLENKKFKGEFHFDQPASNTAVSTILTYQINEIKNF